jgi:hypothetical protein
MGVVRVVESVERACMKQIIRTKINLLTKGKDSDVINQGLEKRRRLQTALILIGVTLLVRNAFAGPEDCRSTFAAWEKAGVEFVSNYESGRELKIETKDGNVIEGVLSSVDSHDGGYDLIAVILDGANKYVVCEHEAQEVYVRPKKFRGSNSE